MVKLLKLSIVSMALAVGYSTAGDAFQLFGETPAQSAVVSKPLATQHAEGHAPAAAGGLDLSDKSRAVTEPASGGDIWIPGLGVVGKMPNFDFGLEMLYGAKEGANSDNSADMMEFEQMKDDFSIKGTIKRKF